MKPGTIIFSLFVGSTLFLAIWAQGHENQHQQGHGDSHGAGPDPNKPFLALWRKRGHNAVNYQYKMHKPVQNGQVDQRGSVTLYKPPHKDNQPDRSGFVVSYRISQDFDSTKPVHHNQINNRGDNSGSVSHGSPHDQPPVHHAPHPSHRAPTQPHQRYRNDDPYRNPGQASGTHCYDTINSNQVFCCMPSYNGGSQRCWRQNNGWDGNFF